MSVEPLTIEHGDNLSTSEVMTLAALSNVLVLRANDIPNLYRKVLNAFCWVLGP
jgi:hypothetical protein